MIHQLIEDLSSEGWEWGAMDCCQFARRVLKELHGIDFAPDAPEYTTAKEALAIVREAGGMERFASQYFGDPVPRNLVKKGDPCMANFPSGLALGICTGQTAAFASKDGIIHIPRANIEMGWNL